MTPEDVTATPNADLRAENAALRAKVEKLETTLAEITIVRAQAVADRISTSLIELKTSLQSENAALRAEVLDLRRVLGPYSTVEIALKALKCNCPGPCNAQGCLMKEIERLRGVGVLDAARVQNCVEDRDAALLQVGALRKLLERVKEQGLNHQCAAEGHIEKYGCDECKANTEAEIDRVLGVTEKPFGQCCEGFAKHCDAHSVGCRFAKKRVEGP
jgi:hypothetical protein